MYNTAVVPTQRHATNKTMLGQQAIKTGTRMSPLGFIASLWTLSQPSEMWDNCKMRLVYGPLNSFSLYHGCCREYWLRRAVYCGIAITLIFEQNILIHCGVSPVILQAAYNFLHVPTVIITLQCCWWQEPRRGLILKLMFARLVQMALLLITINATILYEFARIRAELDLQRMPNTNA